MHEDQKKSKKRMSRKLSSYAELWILVVLAAASFDPLAAQELDRVAVSPVQPYVIPITAKPTQNVLTQRNNNQRTGSTVYQGLDQSSVSVGHFGLIGSIANIKGVVLAQPLFMDSVAFPDGPRPIVFIATSMNRVYAFEADPPFKKRWERDLGPPYALENSYNAHPYACANQMVATIQEEDAATNELKETRVVGIEATPAIDPLLKRMLVSYRNAQGIQRIAALDITTGQIIHESGNLLDREVTSDATWNQLHRSRPSLLLADGFLFVGFAGLCEDTHLPLFKRTYQGWIYAFDAKTLAFAGRYRSTQSTASPPPLNPAQDPVGGGGIWQASTGLAADSRGNVFFATGNATKSISEPDAGGKNLSSSVIRLGAKRESEPGQLPAKLRMEAADWFTPANKVWQDGADMDLGAGGVMLIPGTPYLVMGGKEGVLYVLDRSNMGRFHRDGNYVVQWFQAGFNQYCSALKTVTFCSDHKPAPTGQLTKPTGDDWLPWPHIHGTPVFARFNDGRAFLFIWPEKDHLKSYEWKGNHFDKTSKVASAYGEPNRAVLAPPFLRHTIGSGGMPGGMLSLTIDPSSSGKGVLFASVQRCRASKDESGRFDCSLTHCRVATPAGDPQFGVPGSSCSEQRFGMLRAFDPMTLRELWNNQIDTRASDADKDYGFAKWVPPTIARGRVYLATSSEKVLVYGKL